MAGRIHGGVEVLEQEEGGDDDEDQEECVVVEDGEGGGFIVSHFVLLPQDPESSAKTSVKPQSQQRMSAHWHQRASTKSPGRSKKIPLVFLLAGHLAVIGLRQLPGYLLRNSILSFLGNPVTWRRKKKVISTFGG